MKMLTMMLLVITVYCVDQRVEFDRCFSTKEKATDYCDALNTVNGAAPCKGLYERTHK